MLLRIILFASVLLLSVAHAWAPGASLTKSRGIEQRIEEACRLFGENPDEIFRVIRFESRGYAKAEPPVIVPIHGKPHQESSRGLMGVKPETMQYLKRVYNPGFGEDLFDPINNVMWGLLNRSHLLTRYAKYNSTKYLFLKKQLKIPDSVSVGKYLAIVAYNKGWGYVDKRLQKGLIPYSEYFHYSIRKEEERVIINLDPYPVRRVKYFQIGKDVKIRIESLSHWQKLHDTHFKLKLVSVSQKKGK